MAQRYDPCSDADRLAILAGYDVLDSPPEAAFDQLTGLAAELCETPIALVSLIDAQRQWFLSRVGVTLAETPLPDSVCARAIRSDGVFVVDDLAADARFADTTLVAGAPHLRFYAGAPLRTAAGVRLGMLCVLDTRPRPGGLAPRQLRQLQVLADQVMAQLELRRATAALAAQAADLEKRVAREVAERLKAEAALRQAQKMELVGQLTGGIAHDFGNMLTGICGNLEMLRHRLAAGRLDGLDRYVDGASQAAGRATTLVRRLMGFSRRCDAEAAPTEINALVRATHELLSRTAGGQIEVILELIDAPCTTLCDAALLESALLNIAINARDAMPDGGAITLRTRIEAAPDATLGLEPGTYVCLAVSDTGCGMPPQIVGRVLEPFFTTKAEGSGTGLGLAMVHNFVVQSRGGLRLHSVPGEGTRIELFLPLLPPAG
jgi:signal transduction histidine kinase